MRSPRPLLGALAAGSVVLGASACGGAAAGPATDTTMPPPRLEARGEVCPGWTRYETGSRTIFALPGAATSEDREGATAFVHAEGEVYLELLEQRLPELEGARDRAAIEGVLAGLGDPASQSLPEGWTITSQAIGEWEGRDAILREIDLRAQVTRRERIVRAGPTLVAIVTMVRRDREAEGAETIRCFERSIVLAAPPAR